MVFPGRVHSQGWTAQAKHLLQHSFLQFNETKYSKLQLSKISVHDEFCKRYTICPGFVLEEDKNSDVAKLDGNKVTTPINVK